MIILGTNSIKDTGYNVANSLRFNDGDSQELSFTVDGTPTHQDKGTWSFWIKRGNILGAVVRIFSAYAGGGATQTWIRFDADDKLDIANRVSASFNTRLVTNRVFKDASAWYHIVIAFDSSQGTDSNRVKLYVNGVQETSFATGTYPSQNDDLEANTNGIPITWGAEGVGNDEYFDGYIAETVFIDGQQLAADQFGEFDSDSGIWKPIDVSGLTFGTNGYFLEFKESGTSANASGMGADTSGNTHHFAVTNLAAIDQSTDTCTNNFCTLSPLWNSFNQGTLSEGNLKSSMTSGAYKTNLASFGVSQGKWYWEIKVTQASNVNFLNFGVTDESTNKNIDFKALAGTTLYNNTTGKISIDGSEDGSAAAKFAVGDIVGIALNMDDKEISFFKNGSALFSDVDMSSTSNLVFPFHIAYTYATYIFEYNFGGTQSFAISSGNTDGNGYGNFEYAVPSGYFALCTKNLAEYG